MATPSGNDTVVSLMSEVATPSTAINPSCATFTSTVRPAGVSANDVSGTAVKNGLKLKRLQPVIPIGAPAGSCKVKLLLATASPGFQLSAVIWNMSGPSQELGSVKRAWGATAGALK